MTWKICSTLALLRLSDARSVATEAFRTADFVMAVQMASVTVTALFRSTITSMARPLVTLTLVTRIDGREVGSRRREAEVRLGTLRKSVSGFENAMQI